MSAAAVFPFDELAYRDQLSDDAPGDLVADAAKRGVRRKDLATGAGGFHHHYSEFPPNFEVQPHSHDHDELLTGPDARGPKLLRIEEVPDDALWRVRQVFDDPAGDHDWGISAEVDLAGSDQEGAAVVRVTAVDRM